MIIVKERKLLPLLWKLLRLPMWWCSRWSGSAFFSNSPRTLPMEQSHNSPAAPRSPNFRTIQVCTKDRLTLPLAG